MDLERIATQLRLVRTPDGRAEHGASDAEIDSLEARLRLRVPDSLRTWLRFCNGLIVDTGYLCGIRPDFPIIDIETSYAYRPQEWPALGWIPVAGDGCGNFYLIATKNSGEQVCFCDTISFTTDLRQGVYVVASNLFSFLTGFLSTELGEQWWPFDERRVLEHDPGMAGDLPIPKAWEE